MVSAINMLSRWDRHGRYVYLKRDLRKMFAEPEQTLNDSLDRLIRDKVLVRAARGVFVYQLSSHIDEGTLDMVARSLRRGHLTYESLESALSTYGIISQIPVDRRTYMTSGREGTYVTPYGTIEFTHTAVRPSKLMPDLVTLKGREVPIATKELAMRNLKSTHRNLDLIGPIDPNDPKDPKDPNASKEISHGR